MKKLRLFIGFFLILGFSPLYAATQSNEVGRMSVTPKQQTTKLNETATSATVLSTGEARCPAGNIMIGFNIIDNNGAYVNTMGTRAQSECAGLSAKITNKTTKLMTDPTRITYIIMCRPVNLDFY